MGMAPRCYSAFCGRSRCTGCLPCCHLQRVPQCGKIRTRTSSTRQCGRTMRVGYDRITTTIEREWLAQIIAGTKKVEYRQIKPYWTKRFEKVTVPFELRLLNGMIPPVPEVTFLIHQRNDGASPLG